MSLDVLPLTLAQANGAVESMHRHHNPVVSHRFSIGLFLDGDLVGACIVGRPVARALDPYQVAEVTRLVTDGTPNGCSKLYGAAARACKAMGFARIQTYILESEPGTSLKAAGWDLDVTSRKHGRGWDSRKWKENTVKSAVLRAKVRYSKTFRPVRAVSYPEPKGDDSQTSLFADPTSASTPIPTDQPVLDPGDV